MNSRQKKVIFFGVAVCFLACVIHGFVLRQKESGAAVSDMIISLESGLYAEEQLIVVEAPKGTAVYYTDDYRTPDNQSGKLYESPIRLVAGDDTEPYTYRFKAYYPDGYESEVVTRTYFVGGNANVRYTTNVLHLTGEPEDLFGEERGIFAFGKIFQDFMEENPDAHLGGKIEANFEMRGREWEREVYAEYFTPDGKRIMELDCGIRIYGDTTRRKNQKSFKLYARKEYDEQDDFKYPLLTKLLCEADGTVAKKYERLIVRSGGTDNGYGYIRSELSAELASQAGFPDVMHSEPVCVYINGEYRGIYWLSNAYDEQYFENRYGEYEGSFVVLGGIDTKKEDDAEVQAYVDEYNRLYEAFSRMDLTVDANARALNEVLDIENYLQYFAIQNYVGNWDSIDNNLKVYRYVTAGDSYAEEGAFDGRYRHLLFDLDFGFGLETQNGAFGAGPTGKTLSRFHETSPLFSALMERQDCREYFISYTCDLMNGAMSYENVSQTLVQKHGERDAELRYMLEQTDVQKNSICVEWEGDCIEKYETVVQNYHSILHYAEERPVPVLADLIENYDMSYEDAYTLNVSKSNESTVVKINSAYISRNDFSGPYISTVPVVLTPILSVNEEFSHWVVNGEIYDAQELVLGPKDVIANVVEVQLVTTQISDPILQISAIRAKGNMDYIELVNDSREIVDTGSYYLSDSEEHHKCALPATIVGPGESVRFWGKQCADPDSLGGFSLNFNIKEGEVISLTRGSEVLEEVYVPDLSAEGVYCRGDGAEGFSERIGE